MQSMWYTMKHYQLEDKTLYLFRHAKATGSDVGYGDKIVTATIVPEGIPPIERMAEYLRAVEGSANYSSEFIRCRQTAQIVTRITKKEFTTDKRLNEYYEESFGAFGARVNAFLESLSSARESSVLLCTHGMVIAAVKHMILEGRFMEADKLDYPKTGELWVVNDARVRAIDFNRG